MKTFKNMLLAVAGVATLGSGISFAASSPGETGKNIPAKSSYEKDKANLGKHAANANYNRARIKALEAQLKADKKAGKEEAVINDRLTLRKAKADLKNEKAYVCADKKALKSRHSVAIKSEKKAIREDRAEIRKTKRDLRRDIRRDNETAMTADAACLIKYRKEADKDETALNNQREALKSDLAWTDEATAKKTVTLKQGDLESHEADMAYEGARWLLVADNQ
jgi:hypothetical protein